MEPYPVPPIFPSVLQTLCHRPPVSAEVQALLGRHSSVNLVLFGVTYQPGFQGCGSLVGCFYVCVGGRSHSDSKSSRESPHREASTAWLAHRVGPDCCFPEHQISSWLACRVQRVCKICFFKHQHPPLLWDMLPLGDLAGMRLAEGAQHHVSFSPSPWG